MRWSAKVIVLAAVCLAAAAVWLGRAASAARWRAGIERALRDPDPQVRKQGAWELIEHPDPSLLRSLTAGILGAERDPNVREAYVYTLGRVGDPQYFAAIESAIDLDPSGYVRAAAWLAAARLDPHHFRTLAATRPAHSAWDRIGLLQAELYLGQMSGVGELLDWARRGDAAQRQVACRALFKWLRPLLEAVGRWPLEADVREGREWPTGLIAEIERRCAGLALQELADDARQHAATAARVQRNVGRLTRARDGLAGLLFGRQRKQPPDW